MEQGLPKPLQLPGTDHCTVLSLEGADGGGSSSGSGPGVAPAAPAGASRSSSRNLGSSGGEKEEGKKVRRQWESWSTEDKNTFFEGLYEVSELWGQKRPLKLLASYHLYFSFNFPLPFFTTWLLDLLSRQFQWGASNVTVAGMGPQG